MRRRSAFDMATSMAQVRRAGYYAPVASAVTDDDEIQGKAYDAQLMRRIWQFVRPHKAWLLVSLAVAPIAIGCELSQPVLLRHALDTNIKNGDLAGLWVIAGIYLLLVVGNSMATYAQL